MKLERVVIRGLRALRERNDLYKSSDGKIPSALCLRGLNGSGKTTYLEALAELWQWFRRCTQKRGFAQPTGTPLLAEAQLIAVLATELPGPKERMWIAWGQANEMRRLDGDPDSPFTFQGNRII